MFKIILLLLFLVSSIANAEILKKIEIIGNERIPTNTILMFSDITVGDKIENIDTNNILKKLYDTNFFSNITINLNENILNINVSEYPIVQNVNIEGIKSKKMRDQIIENIFFKEKSSFNELFLKDDRVNLEKILKKNGYYFSDIQISVENLENNQINIYYKFDLGEKSKIRKITFFNFLSLNTLLPKNFILLILDFSPK